MQKYTCMRCRDPYNELERPTKAAEMPTESIEMPAQLLFRPGLQQG